MRVFALVIALPALALYGLSVLLVVVALSGMSGEINRIEQQRGITSMHAALDSFLNGMSRAVSDEGTWDEAFLNVVVTADPAWMDTTWGATARLGESYDTVLVTDQGGEIIFGETATGPVKGNIVDRYAVSRTLLASLDKGIAATTDATTVTGFATDADGPVGLAAISIHRQTTSGDMAVPREARRILWIARHVTPSLLQEFAVRFQTPLGVLSGTVDPGSSSLNLTNPDGKVVGTVVWTPDRPGDAAFDRAILLTSLVFLGAGGGLLVGLAILRQAMLRRAAGPTAAPSNSEAEVIPQNGPQSRRSTDLKEPEAEPGPPGVLEGVNPQRFEIVYQPVLDLRSETLVGVEALLRWTKPDNTQLLQEALAPADRARLFDRIGPIAIRHVTGEVAPLLGVVLTIQATPSQLESGLFAEKVAGTLGAIGFPAQRLQLCVDAELLPEVPRLRDQINELRGRGVGLVVADFTLTNTTAAYLDAGLVDRVRLSPRLTDDADKGAAHAALISATIDAAQAAGAALTAPGIGRKEQAVALLRRGCREFQGELLAKPMPLAALTQLILAPARPAPVKRAS
jgi:EAL domain-containing protein (putative c-di-GMP-specific phosphodiesterase class I)/sensor domain CHASE-containing protein